jgi:hypothetical protein
MVASVVKKIKMKRALEKHAAGEAIVIPIIIRSVHRQDASFSHLQDLPFNGKPVTSWIDRNEAFYCWVRVHIL